MFDSIQDCTYSIQSQSTSSSHCPIPNLPRLDVQPNLSFTEISPQPCTPVDVVYKVNQPRNGSATKGKKESPLLSTPNIAMISLRRLSGESSSSNQTHHHNHHNHHHTIYKQYYQQPKNNKELLIDNVPLLDISDSSSCSSSPHSSRNDEESDQESMIEYGYEERGVKRRGREEDEEMDTSSDNSIIHYEDSMNSIQTPSSSIPINPRHTKEQRHGTGVMLSTLHNVENAHSQSHLQSFSFSSFSPSPTSSSSSSSSSTFLSPLVDGKSCFR